MSAIPLDPELALPELGPPRRGKVRDIYDLGQRLLIVTTDRVSAFDVILPTPIPDKGRVLTALSAFWFELLGERVAHHLLSLDIADLPAPVRARREAFEGRCMLVRKAAVLPVECVVRGYLTGSAWKDYQATGQVCGLPIAPGLPFNARFDEPLFTPATKAELGQHDENIPYARLVELVGDSMASRLRQGSLYVYRRACEHAAARGIILVDTKFEWGLVEGPGGTKELILVDEVLTPDSSRYWESAAWTPGRGIEAYDKQLLRDYLETLDWDKRAPGPELPADIVRRLRQRYFDIHLRITGRELVIP